MAHRINAMHALIKFPEYIPYGLGVMPGHKVGRTDGQTHRINGMHALIKFREYIPYGLRSYGPDRKWDVWMDRRTDGQTDGRTDGQNRWTYGTDRVILNALLLFFE